MIGTDIADLPPAPTEAELRAALADLDHVGATRLRLTARFFLDCGPPLLEMPLDVAAQHYRMMLDAMAGHGFAVEARALPPNYSEPSFRRVLELAAVIADQLRSDVASERLH